MKLVALLAAVTVYVLWRTRHAVWDMIRNPSPTTGKSGVTWVNFLLGRGVDTEPDTDDEDGERDRSYYQLVDVDGHRTRVEWLNQPPASDEWDDEEPAAWIGRQDAAGASYMNIVRDGQRRFGVSDPTMRRWIRAARKERS